MTKVSPGDRLRIGARTWNVLQDVAAAWSAGQPATGRPLVGDPGDKHNRILIRNLTGGKRRRFEVVQIDAQITDDLDPDLVGLDGIVPEAGQHCYAILQEDLAQKKDDELAGMAAVSGASLALVCFVDVDHRFATVVPDSCVLLSCESGPIPIVSPAPDSLCEQTALVLLTEPCFEVTTTTEEPTTTTTVPWDEPECTGQCKWVANASLEWTLDTDSCGSATTAEPTTTTTAEPDPSSTTAEPTTTTTPCCPVHVILTTSTTTADPSSTTTTPDLTSTSTSTTTTTTPEPTTTTTEAPCQCLYPTFCPTQEGECTYTYCGAPDASTEPDCGPTTTAAPTTTTTCDCESTQLPAPCQAGCDWIGLPGDMGWYWWQKTSGCSADCPCSSPAGDPTCATAHTDCVPIPPVTPTPATCGGLCEYECAYLDVAQTKTGWVLVDVSCHRTGSISCSCHGPTQPCTCGENAAVPCVAPPTSTTTAAPPTFTDCQLKCFTTTTTAGPTTTTTIGCETGGCKWRSAGAGLGWTKEDDTCPDACPCLYPDDPPPDACSTQLAGCFGTTAPPTTTTAEPTTTTTAEPTTTTTAAAGYCCLAENCLGPYTEAECTGLGGTWYATVEECAAACIPTTTAPPSTTTTLECVGSTCQLKCDGSYWQPFLDLCLAPCVCHGVSHYQGEPCLPEEFGQTDAGSCETSTTGPPTTTTTAAPTTTTTAPGTTTTAEPVGWCCTNGCYSGYTQSECDGLLGTWYPTLETCVASCSSPTTSTTSSTTGGCWLTTATVTARGLPDDCAELTAMRRLRDVHVKSLPHGNAILWDYYDTAAEIVASIQAEPNAAEIWEAIYTETIVPCVALIQAERYAEAYGIYRARFNQLRAQYCKPKDS